MGLSEAARAARRQGLGASEIAAVVGLSPWAGPLEVWASKVLGHDSPETAAMDRGRRLEPVVLDLYRERVAPVEPNAELVGHPTEPWAVATPDGYEGADTVVEAKTALYPDDEGLEGWGEPGTDEVPQHYLLQTQWQMLVTGRSRARLAVLFLAHWEFRLYEIPRNEVLGRRLLQLGRRFWFDHVLARRRPDFRPTPGARAALEAAHPTAQGGLLPWTKATLDLAGQLAQVRAERRALDARDEELANLLRAVIGDAEGYGEPGRSGMRVTWTANRRGTPNWKSIATALGANEDVIAQHTSPPTRVLRLHGFGGEDAG